MIKLVKKISSYALLAVTLTSCATIVNGTRQPIGISSVPSCASVFVDKEFVGKTPIIVDMTRRDQHYVTIELEGYKPYDVRICKKCSNWVFGNIVFGGFIGLAVDAVSGGLYILTPDQINADMEANGLCYSKQSDMSYIAVVMQPDPSWEKIGNLEIAE